MTEPKKSISLIKHIVEHCTRMSNHGACDNTCLRRIPTTVVLTDQIMCCKKMTDLSRMIQLCCVRHNHKSRLSQLDGKNTHCIYSWRRGKDDLLEFTASIRNGEYREFQWLWTWHGHWCRTGWSEYFTHWKDLLGFSVWGGNYQWNITKMLTVDWMRKAFKITLFRESLWLYIVQHRVCDCCRLSRVCLSPDCRCWCPLLLSNIPELCRCFLPSPLAGNWCCCPTGGDTEETRLEPHTQSSHMV